MQSRYYNPQWGRFLNADAFAATGQDLVGNNMFAYCGNNPVMGYDPQGLVNWGGVFVGIGLAALTVACIALTVVSAGAASPLTATAMVTIGTVASAALAEASVMTTYGAIMEEPVVYDVTITTGQDKVGMSMVYDFGEDTSDLYLHDGKQSQSSYGCTFGSGIVYNYTGDGSYGGEFVDVSASVEYKGASLGVDYCMDPKNITNGNTGCYAILLTSGWSISPMKKSVVYSYDYYWDVG